MFRVILAALSGTLAACLIVSLMTVFLHINVAVGSIPATYSRHYEVLIQTRRSGVWAAHCHNYRNEGPYIRIYGGCLPPKKV
jgi:hypothetical protein